MIKEVNLKWFAGPIDSPPFQNFVQSSIGLVMKSSGDTRLIFHLSWSKDGISSINQCTPRELCRVRYKDLDQAVRLCMKAGKGCYMAKWDMKSAFCHLPIRKEDGCWFVMMAKNTKSGKKYYFYDKYLPFGHSISCSHFQRVSNKIQATFQHCS